MREDIKRRIGSCMNVNFRVEWNPATIRHASVECPYCNSWFIANEIQVKDPDINSSLSLVYESDLYDRSFKCPICKVNFFASSGSNVKDCDYSEVYNGVKRKKEVWE